MDEAKQRFGSIYAHGYARVAVCTPGVEVAHPSRNLEHTLDLARQSDRAHAVVAIFPELGLSAYSIDDLLQQDALLDGVEDAVAALARASADLRPAIVVGAPLRCESKLFNCAVLIHRGRVLGIVPKTYLPSYREFYEKRQFSAAAAAIGDSLRFRGEHVPFGNDLIFVARGWPDLTLHVEICEDLWVPVPPSTMAALAGTFVLANLSASNVTIGKAEYRRLLCASQSARCVAAYLYSGAGFGESTTDLAWDGHGLIYENGELLAESERFAARPTLVTADIDLDRLRQERMRLTSFNDQAAEQRGRLAAMRRITLDLDPPSGDVPLRRAVSRFPFVPADSATRDARCRETYAIQIQGLRKRLVATGIEKAVIGISGGLDSTQAAIVTARTFDSIGLPRRNVLAYTMPGFATGKQTHENAWRLMHALGFTGEEIDIRPSARQMLQDLKHPFARGEPVYDLCFENVQAGERTSHLFRLANRHAALVVGTSDLSELALGYTTYGVGDHMAHYHVNASVPKTLIQHLIRWVIASRELDDQSCAVLQSIVDTKISPELVPGNGDAPAQLAEQTVGPYALQDFFLYYISRFGFRPSKVAFLAQHAWDNAGRGTWPDTIPAEARHAYDLAAIRKWLEVFLVRFVASSQFKRSAMPNAPKVGSGGSLSPRSDWRAPSDARADAWLEELRRNVPDVSLGATAISTPSALGSSPLR